MGIKDQFIKLKDNWIIIVLVLVLLLVMSGAGNFFRSGVSSMSLSKANYAMDAGYAGRYAPSYPGYPQDFAPEVKDRIITKSATLSTEVDRGAYSDAAAKLKGIVTSSDSLILDENVNKYGEEGKEYRQGTYQLKVPVKKYDAVIGQLQAIGKVQSFHESAQDITGSAVDLNTELAAEQGKLARYKQMLEDATIMQDKITLSDSIANQERRVAYLQEQVKTTTTRVDYATVTMSINEKPSEYMNIDFVKLSELWRDLVNSSSALLEFIFYILPWAVVVGIIALIWHFIKR